MFNSLKRFLRKRRSVEFVKFQGLNLPLFRTNQGLSGNQEYLASGVEQLRFLKNEGLLHDNTRIIDFGCGQGRLANCIEFSKTMVAEYVGVDTDRRSVDWCKRFLSGYTRTYNFIHLPAYNARYNKQAKGLTPLPFEERSYDLIFLNSVFSHMLPGDVSFYLEEFKRVLKVDGYIYITAFIEENVPDVEENPEDYLADSRGPLHRVRYEKDFFFRLASDAGLQVHKFIHQGIARTNQSVIVLTN